jgi:hypothetical protein
MAEGGWHFGEYRFDPADQSLSRGGVPVGLSPKAAAVLECLLERAGRLVSKHELLDRVWPDTAVSDASPQSENYGNLLASPCLRTAALHRHRASARVSFVGAGGAGGRAPDGDARARRWSGAMRRWRPCGPPSIAPRPAIGRPC